MCNMTREEQVEEVLEVVEEMEDLVEVEDRLFATIAELLDTMHENIPILPLHVSIAGIYDHTIEECPILFAKM